MKKNVFAIRRQGVVCIVDVALFTTWQAHCRGVLSGNGLLRTASITFARDATSVSQSKLPIWGSGSLRGL